MNPFDPPIPQTNPAELVEQLWPEIDAAIAKVLKSATSSSEVRPRNRVGLLVWGRRGGGLCERYRRPGTDPSKPDSGRLPHLAPSHTAVATIAAIVRSASADVMMWIPTPTGWIR